MRKIIKIDVEVDDTTTNSIIEKALIEKMREFCEFHFWKGSEATIQISDSPSEGGEENNKQTK